MGLFLRRSKANLLFDPVKVDIPRFSVDCMSGPRLRTM